MVSSAEKWCPWAPRMQPALLAACQSASPVGGRGRRHGPSGRTARRWGGPCLSRSRGNPVFPHLKRRVNDVSHYFIDTLICNRILDSNETCREGSPSQELSGPQVLVWITSPVEKLFQFFRQLVQFKYWTTLSDQQVVFTNFFTFRAENLANTLFFISQREARRPRTTCVQFVCSVYVRKCIYNLKTWFRVNLY